MWVSCDYETCLDELWEKDVAEHGMGCSVRNQCSPSGVHFFNNVSVNVERAAQSKMGGGSSQGRQSWGAGSSSWG